MTPIDYLVIFAYLTAVVGLSAYFFAGQKSLRDFFLGDRNIPWWAAAFSGMATLLSAISYLGAPGQAFKSDLRFLQYRLATPFAVFIIGWIFIPFFYRLGLYSIYEYLEHRFDLKTRLTGSALFVLLKCFYLGIAIYAPALLIVQMTGLPVVWVVIATGLFTTLYTSVGGVRSVIWTDTLQLAVLLGGLAAAATLIVSRVGGVGEVMRVAEAHQKLRFLDFSFDFNSEFTFIGGLIGGTFVLLSQYGVNQAELQKLLTPSSLRRSQWALITSMSVSSLIGVLYFFLGSALFVFYLHNPASGGLQTNPDQIFPKFIVEELPAGLKGLLLASVCAAAMSTVSSVLNSLCTVVTEDFYSRLFRRSTNVALARRLTLIIGILCTAIALYVNRLGTILVAATRLTNFFGGSLAGVFLLGMTYRRANGWGAFLGMITGTIGVLLLSLYSPVSWMWHGVFAAGLAYGSGALFSMAFAPPAPKQVTGLVWQRAGESQERLTVEAQVTGAD